MKNAYELYSDLLFSKAGARGIPLSGTFELTARCNLDCKMCYIHKRENDRKAAKQEWTAAQWISLAKSCVSSGMLLLLLTGGEPLLRPDFKEIYTACRKMGLMVSVNTNATLIDEEMMDFFAKDPPVRINITLYGASEETYGALCGRKDAYEQVKTAIAGLKARNIPIKINVSATKENRQDLESMFALVKEWELPLQTATYMFPPARACEQGCFQIERPDPEEAARAQIVYDRARFTREVLKERWENQLAGQRAEEPDRECQELPAEKINCRAGHSTFWVTWDGKLRPCGMMTHPDISLRDRTFPEAWEELRTAREQILFPAKCSGCEIRHVCDMCPAVCYAETGSFTKVPVYACEKAKKYLKFAEQELKLL